MVGIVVDPDGDLAGVASLRDCARRRRHGAAGHRAARRDRSADATRRVQRTFATARSVEFDACWSRCAPPAPDAQRARDAKAGGRRPPPWIPRVLLLVEECFRHAKAIGAWGQAVACLDAASIPADAAGIVLGEGPDDVVPQLSELLAAHRAWERVPATGA